MTEPILPPLKPIPIKDRVSIIFVEKGNIDVLDGAFVVVDKTGVRTHIPLGGVARLMLEPGTRVSHAAINLASRVGTLIVWIAPTIRINFICGFSYLCCFCYYCPFSFYHSHCLQAPSLLSGLRTTLSVFWQQEN